MTLTFEEEVERLTEAGLLTQRQAEAFVHREIEATPRWAAAEDMGIATSTLDDYVGDARRKVEAAGKTVQAVKDIRYQAGEPLSDTDSLYRWNGGDGAATDALPDEQEDDTDQ